MIRTLALPLSLIVLTACGQESTSRPTSESLSDAATASSTTKYASTEAETTGLSLLDHTKFAGTVDAKTVAYIQYDLKKLANWSDTTRPVVLTKFGAMVGLSDVNAATLGQWFMDRMTYIYPDDGQAFEFKLIVPAEKKVYPASFMGDGNHLVAGSNKGAEMFDYYQSVRRQGVEGVLLKFNGQLIPFLSPRTGVMQIGPALFGTDDTLDETKSASHRIVKSIFRLGVLFHESRHSDGNAKAGTFGFAHVNCPSDGSVASEYVGLPACDSYANGAYNVGAQLISVLASLCDNVCNARDASALKSVRIDLLSRLTVSDTAAHYGDAAPETSLGVIDTGSYQIVP